MSKAEAPAIHIPIEHQSAPAETYGDKAIKVAAEEIRTGQFVPEIDNEGFWDCGPTQFLAQHPAVQEAMRRLEREKREAKNPQEAIEKTQMLHEANERAAVPQMWDGQGRWMGQENEEMRLGQVLSPFQFMSKLRRVIGESRVQLNRYAVKETPSAKSGRVALLAKETAARPLIILPGMPEPPKERRNLVMVGTLQWPFGTEWMVMRFDEYGVPTRAKYLGWRTALLTMIQLGVITEKEAHKAFPVAISDASAWYRQQLMMLRNEGKTVN
jgi:hypothetical protein